jgi:hypothetical protein
MYISHREKASVSFYALLLKQFMTLEYGTDWISRNVGTFKVQATLRKISEEHRSQPESYLNMQFPHMHQENDIRNYTGLFLPSL